MLEIFTKNLNKNEPINRQYFKYGIIRPNIELFEFTSKDSYYYHQLSNLKYKALKLSKYDWFNVFTSNYDFETVVKDIDYVDCEDCDGDGWVNPFDDSDDEDFILCKRCNGKGELPEEDDDNSYEYITISFLKIKYVVHYSLLSILKYMNNNGKVYIYEDDTLGVYIKFKNLDMTIYLHLSNFEKPHFNYSHIYSLRDL